MCTWLFDMTYFLQIDKSRLIPITFTFGSFDVENVNDYVNFYNGADDVSLLYSKLTGTISSSLPVITSSGPKTFIKFISDYAGHKNGWDFTYEAGKCGSNIALNNGYGVVSMGLIPNKTISTVCSWNIKALDGAGKVVLYFQDFALATGDIITIFNSNNTQLLQLNSTMNGKNPAILSFNETAISLQYTTVNISNTNISNYIPGHWGAVFHAGRCWGLVEMYELNGTIEDGSYALATPSGSRCEWLIAPVAASKVYVITFEFQFLGLINQKDFIRIYNEDQLVLTITSISAPSSFVIYHERARVVYTTGDQSDGLGFQMTYTAELECPPGYHINSTSDDCQPCRAGTYSLGGLVRSCELCTYGTVSAAGSSGCTECPEGTFADRLGSSTCKLCSAGSFTNTTKTRMCNRCPPGFVCGYFIREHFLRFFQIAPFQGSANCTACNIGYYQDRDGQVECIRCDNYRYSDSVGTPVCTSCPSHTITPYQGAEKLNDCLCQPEYFNYGTNGTECFPCPKGAKCQGMGNPPVALPGYYKYQDAVDQFVKVRIFFIIFHFP